MKLASVFADGMVLQRDVFVPVWGTAEPGSRVTMRFAGHETPALADAAGVWTARLPPMPACAAPGVLEIDSATGDRIRVTDVLVGEVWLCSGQSNMEWPLAQSADAAADVPAAHCPGIRLLTVPRVAAAEPRTEITGGARWQACTPDTAAIFSAVAYYFGRSLHERLRVPVGLINASWGGTLAEAWTSREGLLADPAVREIRETFERDLPQLSRVHEAWAAAVKAIDERTADRENKGYAGGWAAEGEPAGDWGEVVMPGTWQSLIRDISGVFWFRKTVAIPPAWEGLDMSLSIGATDKSDVTYFNNAVVGSVTMAERPDAWCFLRTYPVPGHRVKAGAAVIAVRVHSDKFAGGMTGPADRMRLSCPARPQDPPLTLSGAWQYAIEADYGRIELPPEPVGPGHQNAPSSLFNGLLAPLRPYAIRGAIWYQGESNAGRAEQYRSLFPALIRDWRRAWGQGDFPFYFVQLANYMGCQPQPTESAWAALREAQRLTLALPNTGMAVALDIGEADDIHPRNKHDVGWRLAAQALNQTYGCREIAPCGPLFRFARRDNHAVRLSFDAVDGGLPARNGELRGFAIAGADGRFTWAHAVIEGDQVLVSHPDVPHPAVVRYAWADNPDANLTNAAGLPASSFETPVSG